MAEAAGVSRATVQRVWSARGLKPHLVRTFKLSNDRRFDEKLIDVVGVYLNPPDRAVVLCMGPHTRPENQPPRVSTKPGAVPAGYLCKRVRTAREATA
jgi:hypothetical protein